MYRRTARIASWALRPSTAVQTRSIGRRFLSLAPPVRKSRSWKSIAVRLALAGGLLYYYDTSIVFAEEPDAAIQHLDDSIRRIQESKLPTIDAIVEEKRRRQAEKIADEEKKALEDQTAASMESQHATTAQDPEQEEDALGGLEEEAGQQGAFNEETGEINWDCPCLGGMAHGPCGEEFKAAFSCFVYSKEEPKGMECIDKFKGMQDCFRAHPEIYATELEDEEDEIEAELRADEERHASDTPREAIDHTHNEQMEASQSQPKEAPSPSQHASTPSKSADESDGRADELLHRGHESSDKQSHQRRSSDNAERIERSGDEGREIIPRSAHDTTK